ncbi:MAG: MJ0042-type zinc finger domain-containing protein, partial [Rhodopirellula sp. JB055]
MTFLFTCPHCQAQTEVEDEYSGRTGDCVVCGREITMPDFAG